MGLWGGGSVVHIRIKCGSPVPVREHLRCRVESYRQRQLQAEIMIDVLATLGGERTFAAVSIKSALDKADE